MSEANRDPHAAHVARLCPLGPSHRLLVVYLTVSAIGVKEDTEPRLGQSLGVTIAIIVAFLLPRLPVVAFVNFAPVNTVLSTFGVLLCVGGMLVLVWARQHLGRNWSQTVDNKIGHELVTSGPYHHLRHPMYAGASSPVSVRPSSAAARSSFS
jgi:protein-S-isoprenylcysteine O-methyltransferase Ste14